MLIANPGSVGSSIMFLFSFSRVRTRLTVVRLRPVTCAIRTPVQRSRRMASTRATRSGAVSRSNCLLVTISFFVLGQMDIDL